MLMRFLLNFIYPICWIFPRNKNTWIFGAWNGQAYKDNPRYIFQYVVKAYKQVDAIWITKNKELAKTLNKSGIKAYYSLSLMGILSQCRASVAIFSHSADSEFYPVLLSKGVLRVQTWHGIPLKKIGYDDVLRQIAIKARVKNIIYPYRSDRIDLMFACSFYDKKIYESSFNVDPARVIITGYARNDTLSKKHTSSKISSEKIQALYSPTFRGSPGEDFKLFTETNFNFIEYDKLLGAKNITLYIHLHPVQKISLNDRIKINSCKNIFYIDYNLDSDIYQEWSLYDVLITDYSGSFFDFLLTNKPVVMAPFDLKEYIEMNQGLYFEYSEICPQQSCSNWEEVFSQIAHLVPEYRTKGPSAEYKTIRDRHHHFSDGHSSQRCAAEIDTLIDSLL